MNLVVLQGAFFVLCITIIAYDTVARRVPNWLLIAAIGAHLGALVVTGEALHGMDLSTSLIGFLVGLASFIPLYALRAMGAGDVKFFAILGLLLGARALLPIWLIASVLAGIHALVWYVATRQTMILPPAWMQLRSRMTESTLYQGMMKKREGRCGIPYAAYLAIAAIATVSY